jgi:uncharacterized membrane protein YdjX (TVP38/TMEM64 family)
MAELVDSLPVLCLALFADGATFAFATTVLLLHYGRLHEPWEVAVFGGAASAAGSVLQLWLLRLGLRSDRPWMRRFLPAHDKVTAALARYPSASFLAILLARATPLPDAPIKLVAAAAGYPLPLYFVAIYLGALPYYWLLAALGHTFRIPGWVLVAALVAIAVGVAVDRVVKRRKRA